MSASGGFASPGGAAATGGSDTDGGTLNTTSSFDNLTLNTVGTVTLSSKLNVTAGLTLAGGTLNAAGQAVGVGGDWSASGGAFTAGGDIVTLNGTNQHIHGSTTFFDLSKTVASPDTLTLDAGSTQTITGTLAMHGAANNLLTLASSAWNYAYVNPAAATVSYLNVKNINNSNATAVVCSTGCVNSGHNFNWTLPAQPVSNAVTMNNMQLNNARLGN